MRKWISSLAIAVLLSGCAPSPEQLRSQGVRHLELGRPDQAVQTFDRMVSLYPEEPDALYYLGRAYQAQGRPGMAIVYYKACLDAAPWHEPARQALRQVSRQSSIQTDETVRFLPTR